MPVQAASWIWLDGELVAWDDARIHVLTHAFNHGTGVFEGIRCYATDAGPALFRLPEHVERLGRSGRAILTEAPFGADELASAAAELVAANGFEACYLRMIAFRAYGEMGINLEATPVSVAIAAWEQAPSFPREKRDAGLRTTVSAWRRSDPSTIPPDAKILGGYVNVALARAEAVRAGYDEAIMLGPSGSVAEGTIENVFVVRAGALATPPREDGPLPGITRATIIELAREAGLQCEERTVTRTDLYGAEEIFFTGTGVEIVGVREVDGRELGPPGPVTRMLEAAYRRAAEGRDDRYLHWLTPVETAARLARAS
jgi:branched-chain amino acid aminotransferase